MIKNLEIKGKENLFRSFSMDTSKRKLVEWAGRHPRVPGVRYSREENHCRVVEKTGEECQQGQIIYLGLLNYALSASGYLALHDKMFRE
jgi:hypothetical protein